MGQTELSNLYEIALKIHEVRQLVLEFFEYDHDKVRLWMLTKNPALGGVEPMLMIARGRSEKLIKWINNSLDLNLP